MNLRLLTMCLALPMCLAASPLAGNAADKPALPPGMTPAMMHALMTPLGGPHPPSIPADAKSWFGCIPTMGYHYINPKNIPRGPLYGYYEGKATFTELMLTNAEMLKGDWNDQLKPLPGHTIDHVDIWYEAHGHPGYEVPHFDIHAWYVPHAEHMKYCGNTSGKKPAWL